MAGPGRVHFPGCDYVGDPQFVTRISGERYEAPERCRVVDARYLALDIPAETPPPFVVEEGARVVPVNDLVHLDEAPSQYVVGRLRQDRDRRRRLAPGAHGLATYG